MSHPKIDYKLNEHPRWNRNCFHLQGKGTWPINAGSIKSSPVCPWIARMYNKVLQELWQYWYRVLLLPFQIWLIRSLSEGTSSIHQERKFTLLTRQSPMNCPICFSVMVIFVTYQFPNKFWDMVSQLIFVAEFIGSDVLSRIGMWSSDRLHWSPDWIPCWPEPLRF